VIATRAVRIMSVLAEVVVHELDGDGALPDR
jgi:hypothetical protein